MTPPGVTPEGPPIPPSDDALKTRILTHMNADHHRSLVYYLRAFLHVPHTASRTATLVDVSLTHLTLTTTTNKFTITAHTHTHTHTHTLTLDPPLTSLSEMRARLVALDKEARKILNVDEIQITSYRAPRGLDGFVGLLVFLYLLQYTFLSVTIAHPSGPIYRLWDTVVPGGFGNFELFVRWEFWPVIVCHSVEGWWFERTRLARFGVEKWEGVWWGWMVSVLFEGFPAFKRWDGMVEEKRREREAKRH